MEPLTLFAYYLLFWWLTLFAVLSIGLRTQEEDGEVVPGTEASAPTKPKIWRTLFINTMVSMLLFAAWYYVTHILGFGAKEFSDMLPKPPYAN